MLKNNTQWATLCIRIKRSRHFFIIELNISATWSLVGHNLHYIKFIFYCTI